MAETNGISEIRIGGKIVPLYFGRAAAEEMSNRSIANLSGNSIKLLTDLVYSGMMNNAIANDFPIPPYKEAYNLVEQFSEEEDASEQQEVIWDVFQSSRWGADWVVALEKAKKKVEEMEKALSEIQNP